ncbi:hypothetical protein FNH22_12850 [Fulvivirga sp. M361]|nr:hypothetical protein FNH22_12850 [Fulvivirga sp. M361]
MDFIGTIKESEEGISELSNISGQIRGNKIEFSKKYENLYEIDELGNQTTYAGPQYVFYSGIYDNTKDSFFGEWRIRTIYEYENGSKVTNDTTGYWQMARKSTDVV